MNEQILAQNSDCASPYDDEDQVLTQWQIDHDAYVETIDAYRKAHKDLEKLWELRRTLTKLLIAQRKSLKTCERTDTCTH